MQDGETIRRPDEGPAGELPIRFRGAASEYFGIWIVNLLLTIITLGIWSAWAKVRRKRYFLGSTSIDGHAFEYHARGLQILIGRLIAVCVILGQQILAKSNPTAGTAASIAIFFLLPWVFNRSLRFNARMTSWRNVRFNFRGSYLGALGALLLMPIVGALTLGLLLPVSSRLAANYVVRNLRFGTAEFTGDPRLAPFYGAFFKSLLVAVIGIVATSVITAVWIGFVAGLGGAAQIPQGALVASLVKLGISFPIVALIVGVLGFGPFYRALTRNIVVNAAILQGGHRFRADLSPVRYAWIVVSNLVAQAVSLFFLRPWAAVREWRYVCGHVAAVPGGDLGAFVDSAQTAGGAFGSELMDIGGFEIGL